MKEYHAILLVNGTHKKIGKVEFWALNDEKAVEIIHNVAASFDWPDDLEFIYHQREKSTLDKPDYTIEDLLEDLDVSFRIKKFIRRLSASHDYHYLCSPRWLHNFPAREFLKLRGCGPKTLKKIVEALKKEGYELDLEGLDSSFKIQHS